MRALGWLVVLVVLVSGCSVIGEAAVFEFGSDDLCEWVAAEEVAGSVNAAFGVEVEAIPETTDAGCSWLLVEAGVERGMVEAWEAEWVDFDGDPIDLQAAFSEPVDYADLDPNEWQAVSGHPGLSDGVVYVPGGFGAVAFGVPPREQYLELQVFVDGDHLESSFESQHFAVVDDFLEFLGWVGA